MEDLVAYHDGHFLVKSLIHVDIDNTGFTRGYGAFDCFRAYKRIPFKLKDYLNRLKNNCEKMLIEFPIVDIEEIISRLIEKNNEDNLIFRLYIIDHPEKNKSQLTILCNTEKHFSKTHPEGALCIKSFLDQRIDTSIKSTSYAPSVIALKKAKKAGFDEVLYIGKDNLIHELSKANFFAIKDNTLYSPISNFLEGITRKHTIKIAKQLGFNIQYKNIPLDSIDQYEEFFCTASVRGIRPIKQIDDTEFTIFTKTYLIKNAFKNHSCSDSQNEPNLSFSHC